MDLPNKWDYYSSTNALRQVILYFLKCEKSRSHAISYQSLLLITILQIIAKSLLWTSMSGLYDKYSWYFRQDKIFNEICPRAIPYRPLQAILLGNISSHHDDKIIGLIILPINIGICNLKFLEINGLFCGKLYKCK